MTTQEYLAEWISLRSCGLAPRTIDGYHSLLRLYIAPFLGPVPLDDLQPAAVQALLASVCAAGHSRTAQAVYVLLSAALADAVRIGVLSRSPCDRVLRPRHRRADPRWWSPAEAAALLRAAPKMRWGHAWMLALLCGLRRGEIAGLRWCDVDLPAALLRVRNQRQRLAGRGVCDLPPKSASGRRDLPISAPLLLPLRAELQRQRAVQLRGGKPVSYVVANLDNGPIDPARLDRQLAADLALYGLPTINLHGLRHSMATAALAAGVPMRILQDLLGHAEMATTADIYTHIFSSEKTSAIADITNLLYNSV